MAGDDGENLSWDFEQWAVACCHSPALHNPIEAKRRRVLDVVIDLHHFHVRPIGRQVMIAGNVLTGCGGALYRQLNK